MDTFSVPERHNVDVDANSAIGHQPEQTTYAYDLLGNLDRQTNPNGTIVDYVYDSLSRLDKLAHFLPDATPADLSDNPKLAEFDYSVRADGKRSAVTETFWFDSDGDTVADAHTNVTTWTYDGAGRLIDEVFNHYDNLLDQTEHFTYDLTVNRLELTVDKANDATIDELFTYDYDANDRLLRESFNRDPAGSASASLSSPI